MTENNREFEQVLLEEQLFYRYFRPAREEEDGEIPSKRVRNGTVYHVARLS